MLLDYIILGLISFYVLMSSVVLFFVFNDKFSSKLVIYWTPLKKEHNLKEINEAQQRKIKGSIYFSLILDIAFAFFIGFGLKQAEGMVFFILLLIYSIKDSLFSRYISFVLNSKSS